MVWGIIPSMFKMTNPILGPSKTLLNEQMPSILKHALLAIAPEINVPARLGSGIVPEGVRQLSRDRLCSGLPRILVRLNSCSGPRTEFRCSLS